jgi:hypothetical protein
MQKIKKGDIYTQIKDLYGADNEKLGEKGRNIQILEAKNTGLQFVDFKVVETGKKVIGQYRAHNFLESFELANLDQSLVIKKNKKNKPK